MSRERYWKDISRLTIQEAALFMMGVADPDAHRSHCGESDSYYDCFEITGRDQYNDKCLSLLDAIEAGCITPAKESRDQNGLLQTDTLLLKSAFIAWCLDNGYQNVAESIAPSGSEFPKKDVSNKAQPIRDRAAVLKRHNELSRSNRINPTKTLAAELKVTPCRVRQILQQARRDEEKNSSLNSLTSQMNSLQNCKK